MTTSQVADIASLNAAMLRIVDAARAVLTAKHCLFPWREFGHESHFVGGCDIHRRHVLRHTLSQLDELTTQQESGTGR